MAERSFTKEVQQLLAEPGTVFHGEGILAVTKALLECGVGYVAGYQGSPISHLMDVLADAQPILQQLGVHFESSASEATAAATLSASVMYPIRGAVTWKSTVGTNVASDALANLASGGVTGGAQRDGRVAKARQQHVVAGAGRIARLPVHRFFFGAACAAALTWRRKRRARARSPRAGSSPCRERRRLQEGADRGQRLITFGGRRGRCGRASEAVTHALLSCGMQHTHSMLLLSGCF